MVMKKVEKLYLLVRKKKKSVVAAITIHNLVSTEGVK